MELSLFLTVVILNHAILSNVVLYIHCLDKYLLDDNLIVCVCCLWAAI